MAWIGLFLALTAAAAPDAPVLMVGDEIPAMEVLAGELDKRVKVASDIVTPDKLPPELADRQAVIVYIHRDLPEAAEQAFLSYAESGGKLILLHHSISSGKRKNRTWFQAMGVTLPTGDFAAGGYKYIDDVTFQLVNLAPAHPATRGVKFPEAVPYRGGKKRPAFTMETTEVYLNHVLAGPRTPLLGLRFQDKDGQVHLQDIAAWERPHGKGRIYYFMPGHKPADFANPTYAQILANVVKLR